MHCISLTCTAQAALLAGVCRALNVTTAPSLTTESADNGGQACRHDNLGPLRMHVKSMARTAIEQGMQAGKKWPLPPCTILRRCVLHGARSTGGSDPRSATAGVCITAALGTRGRARAQGIAG
jgi:hypothetical protein